MKKLFYALALSSMSVPALAQGIDAAPTTWPYDSMWGNGWMMGGGMLVMLIVLVLAAIGTISLLRAPAESDPREILRARYAKGELSTEEFEERSRAVGA